MKIKETTFNVLMTTVLLIGVAVSMVYAATKHRAAKQREQFVKDSIKVAIATKDSVEEKVADSIMSNISMSNIAYQFIIVDDSIVVYDYSRLVGTVKLQGALDSLINLDNQ